MKSNASAARSGDQGQTALGNGKNVFKHDARVEAMGAVEELGALLGVVATEIEVSCPLRRRLYEIQANLLDVYDELSAPDEQILENAVYLQLEQQTQAWSDGREAFDSTVMSRGGHTSAMLYLARAVARRAERRLIALAVSDKVSSNSRIYLNRLSDFLPVAARWLDQYLQESGPA